MTYYATNNACLGTDHPHLVAGFVDQSYMEQAESSH